DVLVREGDVDDRPLLPRLVENRQEVRYLAAAQRAVAVHDLRAGVEHRPDAEAVEAERLHQVKIGDDVRRAHAAEVGDEGQKLRRAVDGETIALYADLLRRGVRGAAHRTGQQQCAGGEPARSDLRF